MHENTSLSTGNAQNSSSETIDSGGGKMKGGQMDSLEISMRQIFGESCLQLDLSNGIIETR